MKIVKKVIIAIIFTVLSISIFYIGTGYHMYQEAIGKEKLEDKIEQVKQKENYTKIEEMPKIYLDAVISVEDHRFYTHNGMDGIAIMRAFVNDLKAFDFVEGGSTITQQLAKNLYFTQEKRITRKVAELFLAFELEKNYTKEEILELYLNTSYFGDGYYSVKQASNGYFHKDPLQMDEKESILLAGIPNAPSVYAPTQNPDLAKKRQQQVAQKMIKNGYLTKEEVEKILGE